ncbi:uncharacterized protein LOC117484300 [Xyrichtys novacula]|uniref:Uncharacterized protein LOC117484300 n=1 Tax=Xyrichtys novacula TaxID=13765 RepID=A0AAV1FK81_XYRNO|nr:uncharacterized protein LOC117484300 [Xyrichtys novacula]
MARNALPSSALSAVSSFQRWRRGPQVCPAPPPGPECKGAFNAFSEGPRGWNTKPHKLCSECYRARWYKKQPLPSTGSQQAAMELEPFSQNASFQTFAPPGRRHGGHVDAPVVLEHHIFSKGEWRRARMRDHPWAPITISVDRPVGLRGSPGGHDPAVVARVSAIPDTVAQSDLWSLAEFLTCGFSRDDLHPVRLSMLAAYRSPIAVEGAFFAKLSTTSRSGGFRPATPWCTGLYAEAYGPPTCPAALPFPCVPFPCLPENNGRIKGWLRQRYTSFTFNTCPHRALQCMEGPPIEIHVDPVATLKACQTAAVVPLHWQQRVHEDLLRDEALGIIERVPYGKPVSWCHRMVVTRKHDGSLRRTVDLLPLNKFCRRETFAWESPFHLACRIPKGTWKTVTDAWNGYHSVPLRESDRHLTTFITPFGRWRYTRAPQGFLSSGDGYNRRFDAVLSDYERKE